MRMLFVAAAAAVLSVSAAAQADTTETKSFTFQGVDYTYTVLDKGAAKVIKGKTSPLKQSFNLVLAHGRVSGQFDGHSVAFRADEAKGATTRGGAELVALLTQ